MKDADARGPGLLLLKLARALFDEPVLSALVYPVIADLQHEVQMAGADPYQRALAHLRGIWAFWIVMLLAPLEARALPAAHGSAQDPSLRGAGLLSSLLAVLLASTWPFLEWLTLAIPTMHRTARSASACGTCSC